MSDSIARLVQMIMNAPPEGHLGEGMEPTDDWKNPGWFWHPEDTTYRPFPAGQNPDPSTYYRVVPGEGFGLSHSGHEARFLVPETLGPGASEFRSMFPQLHKINQDRTRFVVP